MAEITGFYSWVEASVEGAPRTLVDQAVRRSIDKLLRYSGLWQVQHDPIQLVADTAEYELTPPENGMLIRVSAVRFKNEPCSPSHAGWGVGYTGGVSPFAYWVPPTTPNTIVIAPTPTGTQETDVDVLNLLGIYTVTADAAEVPDFLLNDYLMPISDGAIAYIIGMPGKVWTDPVEAARREKEFKKGCADARIRAATGNTVSILPVVHGYFA